MTHTWIFVICLGVILKMKLYFCFKLSHHFLNISRTTVGKTILSQNVLTESMKRKKYFKPQITDTLLNMRKVCDIQHIRFDHSDHIGLFLAIKNASCTEYYNI